MIRIVVLLAVAIVVGSRVKRGGWSKEHLRKDAAAVALVSAFGIVVLRVAFKL